MKTRFVSYPLSMMMDKEPIYKFQGIYINTSDDAECLNTEIQAEINLFPITYYTRARGSVAFVALY
jgi:hypothetical protein